MPVLLLQPLIGNAPEHDAPEGADSRDTSEPGVFTRIRRPALINIGAIVTAERYGKGMFMLRLRNGTQLVSSRYHQASFNGLLRPDSPGWRPRVSARQFRPAHGWVLCARFRADY